ncbi:MAG: flagellar basal body-associated protein FliL [Sulfuricurvum sp.]|nr:flagellar basal body-associated protein FliL [Sulfuricurvum sp.]
MAGKEHEDKASEGEEKKKSGNMLLIIIIVVLVLILGIGGVIFALMSGNHDAEAGSEGSVQKEAAAHGEEAPAEGEHATPSAGSGHGEISTEVGIMFPLELFTVNLLSESGRRYLKVEMNLELEGEELALELESKKPVLRDVIIRILSGKSLEEVSTIKGKETLKEEIVNDLNQRVKDGKIKNVYFTDFVVQ